jgi:replication factor C subunit 1
MGKKVVDSSSESEAWIAPAAAAGKGSVEEVHSGDESFKSPPKKRVKTENKKFEKERNSLMSFLSRSNPDTTAVKQVVVSPQSTVNQPPVTGGTKTSPADFFSKVDFKSNKKVAAPIDLDAMEIDTKTATPVETPKVTKTSRPIPVKMASPVKIAAPDSPVPILSSPAKSNLPWSGKSVVVTGALNSMSRDYAVDKIQKILGGKVTTAVSSKTAFLVTGPLLEDGRSFEEGSKYKKYLELKEAGKSHPELLNEDEFLAILAPFEEKPQKDVTSKFSSVSYEVNDSNPSQVKPTSLAHPSQASQVFSPLETKANNLWVEKYRPSTITDLVGNTPQVGRLQDWLRDWESVHVHGQKKPVSFRGASTENLNAKAALISGSPGLGKSSAVLALAKSMGYEVLEFNASDTRSKSAIEELINGAVQSRTLNGVNLTKSGKTLIMMDEVDGMSSGDRGGNQELIQAIKKTKVPIVCICNDRMNAKIRSLANSCLDIRFNKLTRPDIMRRIQWIFKQEGIPENSIFSEAQLNDLIESSGCDMRQILNTLQMESKFRRGMGYGGQASSTSIAKYKDTAIMYTPFDVTKILLTSSQASKLKFQERIELSFIDYDLIPLLIEQNYVKCVEKVTDPRVKEGIRIASEYITFGDRINTIIRNTQNWSLLSDYIISSCVAPSFACNNMLGFPEFPNWLGKNSTSNKNIRLMREVKYMTGSKLRNPVLSGYVDVIYMKLMDILEKGDIDEAVRILNEMEVGKDILTEHLTELRNLPGQEDLYKSKIDSKTKAAFTRAYNASEGKLRVSVGEVKANKVGRGGEEMGEDGGAEEEAAEDAGSDEEEEAAGSTKKPVIGGLIKEAKPTKKAAAAKPSAAKKK